MKFRNHPFQQWNAKGPLKLFNIDDVNVPSYTEGKQLEDSVQFWSSLEK